MDCCRVTRHPPIEFTERCSISIPLSRQPSLGKDTCFDRSAFGDYSRGASGFWVENGEIQHPVEEITIAGHLQDIFAGLVAAGDDVETRNNLQVPSLLVSEMMVAGS